jgi:hypothetical protein
MGMQNACQTGSVLTLDISPTVCGFAIGVLSARLPICGFWQMPEVGGEGAVYCAFSNQLYDTIEANCPSKIVLENPLRPRAIVERTTTENVYRIHAMRGLVWEAGHRTSVPVSGYGADDIRMDLLGRCRWPGGSKEGKEAVVAYVRKLGLDVTDHNAADAVMVWLYVQRRQRGIPDLGGSTAFRDAAD